MNLLAFAARLLLVVAVSVAAHAAEGLDMGRLMRALAAAPAGKVEFRELKHSSLLATPVESRGTLSYRRPDVVEKDVVAPRAERFRIEGDTLSVTRDGKTRSIPLASQPVLAAFAASARMRRPMSSASAAWAAVEAATRKSRRAAKAMGLTSSSNRRS